MSNIAIRVEDLSKKYKIGVARQRHDTLRDAITEALTSVFRPNGHGRVDGSHPSDTIWALKDVSFEVKHGEVVGFIGRNGAGKSTLLKILSRITEPTSGRVEIYGRVGSLLEVGTGFHGELTGRENIYLNGAILGMRKAEIERKFDEIVAFSEVEKFIDTPVKRYSSGMYVRLAFAVAAHLEPEILIVDEVLAVGDHQFQTKCLRKMGDVAKQGRTVLFVSHTMAAVQRLCSVAFLIAHGEILGNGEASDVIRRYAELESDAEPSQISARRDRQGDGKLRILEFVTSSGVEGSTAVIFGSPASFASKYEGLSPLRNVHISLGFYNTSGEGVLYVSNDLSGGLFDSLPSNGYCVCHVEKLALLPGNYNINVYCTVNGVLADYVVNAARIHVADGDYFGTGKLPPTGYGAVVVPHRWDVIES